MSRDGQSVWFDDYLDDGDELVKEVSQTPWCTWKGGPLRKLALGEFVDS